MSNQSPNSVSLNEPTSIPNAELLPLVEAIRQATGYKPALSTALRWCQRSNQHGIRLQSWKLGGSRRTTVIEVLRYLEANTRAADTGGFAVATSKQQSDAHAKAMAELEKAGV